jgi:hypothetical protein
MKAEKPNQGQYPRHVFDEKIHRGQLCPAERVITDNHTIQTIGLNKKGADTMQEKPTRQEPPTRETGIFTKRIGSTNYQVSVHFSKTSRETMNEKIMRLIKNDTGEKGAGK